MEHPGDFCVFPLVSIPHLQPTVPVCNRAALKDKLQEDVFELCLVLEGSLIIQKDSVQHWSIKEVSTLIQGCKGDGVLWLKAAVGLRKVIG